MNDLVVSKPGLVIPMLGAGVIAANMVKTVDPLLDVLYQAGDSVTDYLADKAVQFTDSTEAEAKNLLKRTEAKLKKKRNRKSGKGKKNGKKNKAKKSQSQSRRSEVQKERSNNE